MKKIITNNHGITLVVLVIMIIVMLILAGVATSTGLNSLEKSRVSAFMSDMQVIQAKVNAECDKYSLDVLNSKGSTLSNSKLTELSDALDGANLSTYRYFDSKNFQELGIDGIKRGVLINFETRDIISVDGVKLNGNMYYRSADIPTTMYNVEYDKTRIKIQEGEPEYGFAMTKYNYGTSTTIVCNIENSHKYVSKYRFEYMLAGSTAWIQVYNENSFTVDKSGTYDVRLIDAADNTPISTRQIEVAIHNAPNLANGMTAVAWDSANNEITPAAGLWYDYASTDKKWANAKTDDGSYWVWIPRYAYQIATGYHTGGTTGGAVNVKFLNKDNTSITIGAAPTYSGNSQTNYVVHPAFQDGSSAGKNNKYVNGEWDKELSGIWVAKFEASRANATAISVGRTNVPRSVPSVKIWINMGISGMYTISLDYGNAIGHPEYNSHMIKNSEWGAIAYLTQSRYGRNGTEISINQCSNYITGAGVGADNVVSGATYEYSAANFNTTYAWTTARGQLTSTTGNVYGVYDMSGGSYEKTASYVANGSTLLTEFGGSFTSAVESSTPLSTKYVTVYAMGDTDTDANNYARLSPVSSPTTFKYGDAIWETSSNGTNATPYSWFSDSSAFPYSNGPFFDRGRRIRC